jgi:hypothetical protein
MKKRLALMTVLIFGLSVAMMSCVTTQVKPTEANFVAPKVELKSIQLECYEGFWYYGKAAVEKGTAPQFGGSSPVTLDFVFEITNSNPFPVNLESAQFFLFFDDYDLRVVNDNNSQWIPPGKTNTKVLHVTLTASTTWAKFLLAGKELAAKRGDDPWKKVEGWWLGLPDMKFPIDLKDGAFVFKADGVTKAVPINIRYP